MTTGRKADAGLSFLRHFHMIFQYLIAKTTPSAAVYGRAECATLHYLQFGRALGIPFTTTNTSSMEEKGVPLF
jgi:hypothetical protein